MTKEPIFIIGEQRSGSNLLRLILNKVPEIAAPHPPHIIPRIGPHLSNYGNLSEIANFRTLVDDVADLIETNPVPWLGFEPNRNLAQKLNQKSLWHIFEYFMDQYRDSKEAQFWVCKSMENVRWIDQIENHFESKAKFVYLYRDPRDVAASFKKTLIGHKHVFFITKKWLELQQLCLNAEKTLPKERIHRVKYEDLISEPSITIKSLLHFMNLDYRKEALEYYMSPEAINTSAASKQWKKVGLPIDSNNSGKFRKELSPEEILIVESIAADCMQTLGYSQIHSKNDLLSFSDREVDLFKKKDLELQAFVSKNASQNELDKRKRQMDVLKRIRTTKHFLEC